MSSEMFDCVHCMDVLHWVSSKERSERRERQDVTCWVGSEMFDWVVASRWVSGKEMNEERED